MRLRHGPKSPARSTNYIQLIVAPNKEFIFFQSRNGPFIPTLRMLHRYPDMLPFFRVDRGAIRFVLSGANVMSPGLTSAGGSMDDVEEGAVVAIMAEEKQHALGIGVTTKSTKAVREENKGAARPRNERRRQPRLLTLASLARSTAAWPWPTLRIARAGVAIETTHYLKDGLWMMPTVPS